MSREERAINKKDLKPVDHSKMEYIPFRKNFWIDPPDVTRYSTAEIDALRRELDNIRVRVRCYNLRESKKKKKREIFSLYLFFVCLIGLRENKKKFFYFVKLLS